MKKKSGGYSTLPEIKGTQEDTPADYVVGKFLRRGFDALTPEDLATTVINPNYSSAFRAKTGEDWAAKYKSRVVERLHIAKFDISWLNKAATLSGQFKPLFELCRQGNIGSVAEYVKASGSDCLFAVDGDLCSPLHVACVSGHAELAEALINMGSKLEARDVLLRTPLHAAVEKEQEAVVRSLIKLGADLLAKDSVTCA
eukprot:TRINITY_DN106_c0_g6_i1.p2 TRINITY_DN106_c0_g6~~TRINITY_DN106_c0_g6_i1.p2  ORF type:complete len:199 (-),score=47.45 TRINITY_DN106_c0_g6_i1:621-1217(-)